MGPACQMPLNLTQGLREAWSKLKCCLKQSCKIGSRIRRMDIPHLLAIPCNPPLNLNCIMRFMGDPAINCGLSGEKFQDAEKPETKEPRGREAVGRVQGREGQSICGLI